ncbi:MAG: hypothetical protein CVU98_02135 [Firmicutes bacterium HGW-Firmicutes-3]|jgi:hypothetical protein|nr:MAG: hypothetical protein CVU98_02135 [Firmicutes bacterium HGW-Firmicutes-3]
MMPNADLYAIIVLDSYGNTASFSALNGVGVYAPEVLNTIDGKYVEMNGTSMAASYFIVTQVYNQLILNTQLSHL